MGGGGGLIETGSLFKLEKTVVSVLHKELEYKVEKLKYDKVGDHAAEDHWESNPTFQPGPGVGGGEGTPANHPGSVHRKFYRRDHGLIQTLIY